MKQIQARYQWVDMLRGCAVALMIVYHFCYDLTYFRIYYFDFYQSLFWLGARAFIVSLFLLLVGISLQLSVSRVSGNDYFRRAYMRRLFWLVICSLLVSVSSYYFSPSRWIFFGILHFISVASVLGLLFVNWPRLSLGLGVIFIVLGVYGEFPVFDHPLLQWVGLMTHKPMTEDYVPLLPWFGVVLLGLYIGHRFVIGGRSVATVEKGGGLKLIKLAGRHSLLIYMLHQPVMLGMLALLSGQLL